MELENIILSEATQSQNNTDVMHSLKVGINPEVWNTQNIIHRSNESQEEGRTKDGYSGPSYKGEQNTHSRRYRDNVWIRE